jgi:hypothetical protein
MLSTTTQISKTNHSWRHYQNRSRRTKWRINYHDHRTGRYDPHPTTQQTSFQSSDRKPIYSSPTNYLARHVWRLKVLSSSKATINRNSGADAHFPETQVMLDAPVNRLPHQACIDPSLCIRLQEVLQEMGRKHLHCHQENTSDTTKHSSPAH